MKNITFPKSEGLWMAKVYPFIAIIEAEIRLRRTAKAVRNFVLLRKAEGKSLYK